MITSKLRLLIPAVVLLAFACTSVDAAKLTQKQKFEKAIKNELTKKGVSAQRLEAALRAQIRTFTKSLKKEDMVDVLEVAAVPAKFQTMVDGLVAEIKPAPKVPPLSATVKAKIKEIQDKFEAVVDTELNKFPASKTPTKDPLRYVKKHLKQIHTALNDVEWNDFRLFGKDGKAYPGTMKKNDGTVLSSTDIPNEVVFTGDLDGLDTNAVKDAAAQAVADAKAEKAGKKAKSGVDKAKAAAAELTTLKGEIDAAIADLSKEIKAGTDLIAKVDVKAQPLLKVVGVDPIKVTAYTDTKDSLEKAITAATPVKKFEDRNDALTVPGAPAAGDLAQLKADIATGKILKTEIIASTKAINDLQAPFNDAYKALKPAKAPKSDLTPEMETWLVANPEINFKKGLKTVKHKIAGKTIAEVKASIKAALDDFKTTSVWTAAGGDAAQEDALIAAKLDDAGVPASLR